MYQIGPFIIKAKCLGYPDDDAKPLWRWTGFHHYLFTLFNITLGFIFYGVEGAAGAWIATCMHYLIKEIREGGKQFEVLDFLTPLVFGQITIIILLNIERLIQYATS
jgi:hypothetical protein